MLIHIGYGFWVDDAKVIAVLPWEQGSVQTLFRKALKINKVIDAAPWVKGTKGKTRQGITRSVLVLDTESGHYYLKTILSPSLFVKRQKRVYQQHVGPSG